MFLNRVIKRVMDKLGPNKAASPQIRHSPAITRNTKYGTHTRLVNFAAVLLGIAIFSQDRSGKAGNDLRSFLKNGYG